LDPGAGSLEAGLGRAEEVPAFNLDPEVTGGMDDFVEVVVGRTKVLATVSAGVEAARDFILDAVSRFEGEEVGAIDNLTGIARAAGLLGNPPGAGRVVVRFVWAVPSAPKALVADAEGRVRPGRGTVEPGKAVRVEVGGKEDLAGGAMEVGLKLGRAGGPILPGAGLEAREGGAILPRGREVGAVRAVECKADTPVLEDPARGTVGRGGGGIADDLAEAVLPVLGAGIVILGANSFSDRGLASPV
jgi:hypothetical protein